MNINEINHKKNLTISLFSGAGIGDKGLEYAGYNFILHNELNYERAALIKTNFPSSNVITGDILKEEKYILDKVNQILKQNKEIFAIISTPPCQGMSQNGLGKLLDNIRKGKRPKLDPRNRLIIPALRIASQLKPQWIIFENVSQMSNTIIKDEQGNLVNILDLIPEYLGKEYVGESKVIEFADYGIPQRRKRLITIYSRLDNAKKFLNNGGSLIPEKTHDKLGKNNLQKWVTVRDVIAKFTPLDSKDKTTAFCAEIPLHYVPVLEQKKYDWISFTPENDSAFNNQCINPKCGFQNNPKHGTSRNKLGINRANKNTPLYCLKCGKLLPRPYTEEKDGSLRIMSGYTSAYKRMSWDLPASTLTKNLSYPCSDNKIHPSQNRVLSLAEASTLHTISDFHYQWGPIIINGEKFAQAKDSLIRDAIGESIPPKFMYILGKHLLNITNGQIFQMGRREMQLELLSLVN